MTFHVWFRLLSSVPLIYSFLNLTDGLAFSDNDTYTHVDENWFKLVCRIGINDHNTNSTHTLVSMKIGYTELASDAHVDHVLEGLVQVVAHLLDLHLLREQIFLHLKINQQSINQQSTMCNESINQSINQSTMCNQLINQLINS